MKDDDFSIGVSLSPFRNRSGPDEGRFAAPGISEHGEEPGLFDFLQKLSGELIATKEFFPVFFFKLAEAYVGIFGIEFPGDHGIHHFGNQGGNHEDFLFQGDQIRKVAAIVILSLDVDFFEVAL